MPSFPLKEGQLFAVAISESSLRGCRQSLRFVPVKPRTAALIVLRYSYANRRAARLLYRFRLSLPLGIVLALVAGSGLNLTRRLVFGEIKFLLNFGLTPGKLVVTLVMLEGRVDFALKFLRPLL